MRNVEIRPVPPRLFEPAQLVARPLVTTAEEWAKFGEAADRQGITLEQWVNLALTTYLEMAPPPRHALGCPKGCGKPFICTSCGLPFGACMGAADDRPDECDGCRNSGR